MSDVGVIDYRDVAGFIESLGEDGEGLSAQEVLTANLVWSVWEQFGTRETSPEIGDVEAVKILERMPVEYDEVGRYVKDDEARMKQDEDAYIRELTGFSCRTRGCGAVLYGNGEFPPRQRSGGVMVE